MLIIDNRECKLIDLIKTNSFFKIDYEIKSLLIGDIIIISPLYPDKQIIIERKSVSDMLSSIKDGRYKEQKIRLLAEKAKDKNNVLLCYLLEGSIQDIRYPNEKNVFHGSIISSIFRDEIPLIRSISLTETLEIITRMHDRMIKNINDFFKPIHIIENTNENTNINANINNNDLLQINEDTSSNTSYLHSIKKSKKDNLTTLLWNQISFANIPSISTTIAAKISKKYPTIRKLIIAYDKCNTDIERIRLISEINLYDSEYTKQKRRIGNVVGARVLQYLYTESTIESNIESTIESNIESTIESTIE